MSLGETFSGAPMETHGDNLRTLIAAQLALLRGETGKGEPHSGTYDINQQGLMVGHVTVRSTSITDASIQIPKIDGHTIYTLAGEKLSSQHFRDGNPNGAECIHTNDRDGGIGVLSWLRLLLFACNDTV